MVAIKTVYINLSRHRRGITPISQQWEKTRNIPRLFLIPCKVFVGDKIGIKCKMRGLAER